jgi:hypothetical protein
MMGNTKSQTNRQQAQGVKHPRQGRPIAIDKEAMSRLSALLSTYAILAGLLAAACYPAIYGTRELGCSDTNGIHLGCPWVPGLGDLFRALNVVSLIMSLAVMVLVVGIVVLCQNNYSAELLTLTGMGENMYKVGLWVLLPLLTLLAVASAVAATITAALGFLPAPHGRVCLAVLVIVIVAALAWWLTFWIALKGTMREHYTSDQAKNIIACALAKLVIFQKQRRTRVRSYKLNGGDDDINSRYQRLSTVVGHSMFSHVASSSSPNTAKGPEKPGMKDVGFIDLVDLYLQCLNQYRTYDPTSVVPAALASCHNFITHLRDEYSWLTLGAPEKQTGMLYLSEVTDDLLNWLLLVTTGVWEDVAVPVDEP